MREEILEAADQLLVEAGSESRVSIQAIADAVGCTPPAIYMHFADKDALMFEVSSHHFERFVGALANAETDAADPLEVLRSRARAFVEYGLENPEPYRILFMQRTGDSASRGAVVTVADLFQLLSAAAEDCLDSGLLPQGDPLVVSCAIWASVHGLTSLMISNPDYPWPSVEDLLEIGIGAITSTGSD